MSSVKNKVKLIKLSDKFQDNSRKYPFIHSIQSNIRFRLRSKITYDHQPVLLIEKLNSFDYILPMKVQFDLCSNPCQQNFICLKGKFDEDGAWYTQLTDKVPGIVSFQIAFVPYGSTIATKYGTCDVVFLTQDDAQLRKIRKQTVFPRCIGKFPEWSQYFTRQMDLGYNSFHFAPIQQTGNSKSYYSLKDHLDLSEDIFQGTIQQKKRQLKNLITQFKQKGIIFFIDIVLNHCSFDAVWIKEHPDSVYTPENTPHLRPAFLVDEVIYKWGQQIKTLMIQNSQGEQIVFNEQFVQEIQHNLKTALYLLNLQEYFILSDQVQETLLKSVAPRKPSENLFARDPIDIIEQFITNNICNQCKQKRKVQLNNLNLWMQLNVAYQPSDLKMAIHNYNQKWIKKIKQEYIPQIVRNTINQVRHVYLNNNYRQFDDPYPFVSKYFSRINTKNNDGHFYALNNGWVAGADSSQNFALSQQYYYLRRRVNVWGDLLRIRYGDKPSDSPYAWEYMKQYVQEMAQYFQGFRLDNCHGTQLNVARYMIKQARQINPKIIIFAELFTDTEQQKALFVRTIGINSTLKQAQHLLSGPAFIYNIHDSLGKGAKYVGGLNRYMQQKNEIVKYSTRKKPVMLVYDLTHDNETYVQKKIQILQTPITVITGLMGAFLGSTKGFDQFYAHKIQVIQSKQIYSWDHKSHINIDKSQIQKVKFTYPATGINNVSLFGSWNDWKQGTQMQLCSISNLYWAYIEIPPGSYQYKFYNLKNKEWMVHPLKRVNERQNHWFNLESGERAFKRINTNLEQIRTTISKFSDKFFNYSQYYTFNIKDIVIIIRQDIQHQGSICIIANLSTQSQRFPNSIQLPGKITQSHIFKQSQYSMYQHHIQVSQIVTSHNLLQYFDISFSQSKGKDILFTNQIPAGFGCVIQCRKTKKQIQAIRQVKDLVNRPLRLPQLDPLDCNLIMYGSTREEETIYGSSNYVIPQNNNQQLVYGGFAAIFTMIKNAKKDNNLSDKLFDNLRQGDWLMDYYLARLKRSSNLVEITDKVQKMFNSLKALPRYLIPKYFCDFVYRFCHAVQQKMSNCSMSVFERKLKTASCQFINKFPNQKPGFQILFAAGLPHFSSGWARCWGRDTFTCNELLLTYPKIYKQIIIQFASALRHGMIPNLLDSGNNPRYNCRDACWWLIRGICQYSKKTNDYQIFKQKVSMLFLSDDLIQHNRLKKQNKSKTLSIQQIIHEIIQYHASGISYRQWRAGYLIDSNMSTEGFNIQIKVDEETGFIDGGNQFNCLTWMDKMGSSLKAGTKGYPATPRAGEPVELVGLLKNCLTSLVKLNQQGYYAFNQVNFKKRNVKYSEWAKKIHQNFEKKFFIPQKQQIRSSSEFADNYQQQYLTPGIKIRGIYKDICKAKIVSEQNRLRPNALITLALAPEMINPQHARQYLQNVQTYLLSPNSLGISTLSQVHQSLYLPYYDNSDDSTQLKSAHGFSYHNGPQWVWLYGFYVVAKIKFDSSNVSKKRMLGLIQQHINFINNDQWCSLPEMTNKNGQRNHFSCPAQAWSVSSLLMALEEVNKMKDDENQLKNGK